MEFGRTDIATLDQINFTLPAEPPANKLVLNGKPAISPRVYLGCPTWGSKAWVGKLFPPNTKEKQFSSLYPQHFNSIELNATHYKIYEPSFVEKWREQAEQAKEFIFCPKIFNGITHEGNLTGKGDLLQAYLESIGHLQPYLGPVFIQLSDNFNRYRKQELFAFLETLPSGQSFFLELRQCGWFNSESIREEWLGFLRQRQIGAVITDTPGRRDCAHMALTVPKTFIRYVGNNLHATDFTRIDAWAERLLTWLRNGLQELYFFVHMPNEECCPELIAYLAGKLNAGAGLNIPLPQLRKQAATPFQGRMFD